MTSVGLFVSQMVLFGLETVVVHHIGPDVAITQVALARNIGGLLLAVILYGRVSVDIFRTQILGLQLLRGLVTLVTTWTLIYCFTTLPLAAAAALFYVTAVFMTLFGILTFKETVPPSRWLALALGWVGTLVILRPAFQSFEWAHVLALVGALGNAIALTMNCQLKRADAPVTVLAYVSVVGIVGNLQGATVPDANTLPWLALMMVPGPIGLYLGILAVRRGALSLLAPLNYLRPVFAALLGVVLFSEWPDAWALVGAAVVCVSCMVNLK